MDRSELKQILKPLIKECIKECIFEEGVLSGIIKEVAQGMNGNVVVEAKMLTGRDEAALVKMQQTKSKHGAGEQNLTSQFKMFIESVNGHTDRGTISKFVDNMPATDSRHLRTVYGKSVPNVDLTQKFFCEECLTETTMEVPLTADFFWPDR